MTPKSAEHLKLHMKTEAEGAANSGGVSREEGLWSYTDVTG